MTHFPEPASPETLNTVPESLNYRILVLHQNPDFLQHCWSLIEAKGYEVIACDNGSEAVGRIYNLQPDLLVVGTALPEINGYQICRLVKNDPEIKKMVVILIAEGQEEKMDRFWGFKAGADDFLRQDEVDGKLLPHIRMFLKIYDKIREHDQDGNTAPLPRFSEDMVNTRARLTQILDKSLIESTLMNEFRNLNDLIHDKILLCFMLFSLLESLLDYDLAALFFNDHNREPRLVTFHIPSHLPDTSRIDGSALETLKNSFFSRVSRREAIPKQFDLVDFDVVGEVREASMNAASRFEHCHFQEFFIDNTLIGAFALYSREPRDYSRIFPVNLIESELKLLMKLRYLYSQAEMLAITDGLTALYNYRHFMATLDKEFKRAKRYHLKFSLAMVDIDHFKDFNDRWGHLLGDEMLKQVAGLTDQCFRSIDFVARYGGEELAIIFPESNIHEAAVACERFRRMVEKNTVTWQEETLTTSISIGLASLTDEMSSPSDLIRLVDQRLYEAKKSGRNCIVTT